MPLAERLACVGLSKEAVAKINMLFDVLQARNVNEFPAYAKQLLAKLADAEYSAIDQLAALIESRRKA
jgi:hypothetical protein